MLQNTFVNVNLKHFGNRTLQSFYFKVSCCNFGVFCQYKCNVWLRNLSAGATKYFTLISELLKCNGYFSLFSDVLGKLLLALYFTLLQSPTCSTNNAEPLFLHDVHKAAERRGSLVGKGSLKNQETFLCNRLRTEVLERIFLGVELLCHSEAMKCNGAFPPALLCSALLAFIPFLLGRVPCI